MYEKFKKYLEFERRYSSHTIKSYTTDLKQLSDFLNTSYELNKPEKADHQILRSWLVHLVQTGVSPKTINRKLATLKSFYKFLKREGFIDTLPTSKLIAPKVSKKLPEFIPEAQISNLLNNFKFENSINGLRDNLIIEFLYGTGIRLSELITLREKNIDLNIKIVKVLGKGNKERLIPLNTELVNLTRIYLEKKEVVPHNKSEFLIVTNTGNNLYPMFVYRIVRKYLDQVTSIEKRSPHVLRHTFATHLLNKGADLNAIKELLGHSSLAATQVYTHNSLEKIKGIYKQAHPKA
jgi:integrase/recombinase XerC